MFELKGFCKKYNSTAILDEVSLSLQKGEIALLLGPSGVGKSTLLRAINNLEKIDKGEIFFEGKSIELHSINQQHLIGFVFQHFNLFEHLDAMHNLVLPLQICFKKGKEQAKKEAINLLQNYGLFEKIELYPSQLSGGQKQLLAIARAIAMGSRVLCMDEPTSALDPTATNQVVQHIAHLATQGYIILIATHDCALIEKFNCTIHLMKQGKIIEAAGSKEFLLERHRFPLIADHLLG